MCKRISSYLLSLLLLLPVVPMPDAQAGVLLRSSQVRSRVRTRTPRVRLGYQSASTWVSVSRKINPINTATLSSEKALSRYAKRRERYIREVERFQKRQEREREREARQKAREEAREQRRLKREYARKVELQKRRAKVENERPGSPEVSERKSGEAGALTAGQGTRRSEQATFWSRFWAKLIGRPES